MRIRKWNIASYLLVFAFLVVNGAGRGLALATGLSTGTAEALTEEQKEEVLSEAWKRIKDEFYDPSFRGVNWNEVQAEYVKRLTAVHNRQEMADLLRSMLGRLNNSHTFFFTREEFALSRNVLPFFFEHRGNKVFVSEVLTLLDKRLNNPVRYGDQILAIDDLPAKALDLPLWVGLYSPVGNAYLGSAGSKASIRIRRLNRQQTIELPRITRFSGVETVSLRRFKENIAVLRLISLGGGRAAKIRSLLAETGGLKALVIDLRYCAGGDLEGSLLLASILLGPDKAFYTEVGRENGPPLPIVVYSANPPDSGAIAKALEQNRVEIRTYDEPVRFSKPIAILVNRNTASEAEIFAAALQEHGRGRIFGTRTTGAVAGWTRASDLPHGVGMMAVPYTYPLSPKGKRYEGIGVLPDEPVENDISDFREGRDRTLEAATRYLAGKLPHMP